MKNETVSEINATEEEIEQWKVKAKEFAPDRPYVAKNLRAAAACEQPMPAGKYRLACFQAYMEDRLKEEK